jgi:hypothetical protein
VVKKRSACKEYQTIRQGGYESLISYRERYDAALTAYQDQGNPALNTMDQAMDFFDGLDNGRYAQFKADIHNAMTSKTMTDPPKDVDAVYDMAANWVKTQSVQRHGTSMTFVTTVDKKLQGNRMLGRSRMVQEMARNQTKVARKRRNRVLKRKRISRVLIAARRDTMQISALTKGKQQKNQTKRITYVPCMPPGRHRCT